MLLLLACADPPLSDADPVIGAPMDGIPDATVRAGDWVVVSRHGRARISGPAEIDLGAEVLPEFAFNADVTAVVFPQAVGSALADLFLVSLPEGRRQRLTDWPGSEDRPAFSPDGKRLAFFSSKTGLSSLFVLDLATGEIVQVTNVGLEHTRRLGGPPDGWVPPATSSLPSWDHLGVHYQSASGPITVEIP